LNKDLKLTDNEKKNFMKNLNNPENEIMGTSNNKKIFCGSSSSKIVMQPTNSQNLNVYKKIEPSIPMMSMLTVPSI